MQQPIASFTKRSLSFMIDDFIVLILMLFIFSKQLTQLAETIPDIADIQAYTDAVNSASRIFMTQYLLYILLLKVIYHGLLVGYGGMTVGKYFTKTKVVNLDGSDIGYVQAILRAAIRLSSEMLFYLGFIVALFTPKRQTLHGLVSKSIVVDVSRD